LSLEKWTGTALESYILIRLRRRRLCEEGRAWLGKGRRL